MMPLGNAPVLMTVSADEPSGLHVALAFHVDVCAHDAPYDKSHMPFAFA
jgi:hypothetical protein